jgi:hypothetical protein
MCHVRLSTGSNGNPIKEQPCGHIYRRNNKGFHDGCYTLILPVEEQLLYFIDNYLVNPTQLMPSREDMIGDVVSGSLYKENKDKGSICEKTTNLHHQHGRNEQVSIEQVCCLALHGCDKRNPI